MELLIGDLLRHFCHMGELRGIRLGEFGHIGVMFARNDEHMHLGLRIDVLEGVGGFILIHLLAGNLAGDDLAEQTILVAHNAPFIGIENLRYHATPAVNGAVRTAHPPKNEIRRSVPKHARATTTQQDPPRTPAGYCFQARTPRPRPS